LLPVGVSQVPRGETRKRFACPELTRPPVTAGSRSAFPCQTDVRLACSEQGRLPYYLPC